jgi:hypothetical protein
VAKKDVDVGVIGTIYKDLSLAGELRNIDSEFVMGGFEC